MRLVLDAQLPHALAPWVASRFGVTREHVPGTPRAGCSDAEIFRSLREPGSVVVSKDEDFVDLVTRLDPPPRVVWVRCGNVTNGALRSRLEVAMPRVLELLARGDAIVELA
jgi:predicted nuclease of predicted toxin-antitoxin system